MEALFKKTLFVLLSLFLCVMTITGIVVAVRLANHQAVWVGQPASIMVSGTEKVQYTPDIAIMGIAVIAKGTDPVQVQDENNKNMQGVIAYLKQSGIASEDIQTTTYNLYPEYAYTDRGADTAKIIGYTLHQSIVCKIRKDLSKVGSIIGGLTDAGANSIESIQFSLSDEAKIELETQAKSKAISDAKVRFEGLRKEFKFRVLRLTNVQDTPAWASDTMRSYAMKEGIEGGGAPAPIEPGSGELTSYVTLTFEIK
ncbi:MAG: hypothetical protein UX65_C0001G0042 [Parcubacteria group bacterium GW2011_GWB1_46_8]|nr:MAG: hypothetical protein UX14_C0003G0020 [Parcubacteria group bacterium GW2011_GWF1_45_5]KKU43556.1 MAG: hypothetical protein UX61_C0016G0008 [Parcubacteria group bacterium GW2011_GWA2_46_7]KKU46648.1 MAG: hypothetical protein UX65_C0001G0042 [Parcubacteria group bacterium GW2011_GWB1_46_8]KKU47786.1 MAG: hypothetical protein UX66_C0005G0008 [Parcubacteria group bacterium GW2011_GWF2_46_8]